MDSPIRSASASRHGTRSAPTGVVPRDPLAVLGCLTPRDRQLLSLIGEQQVLTTSQITRLAFPSRTMAQRRLLRLYQLGVLDRFRWHQIVGSQDWHYTLGLLGGALLAAARATTPPSPAEQRRRVTRLAASPRLMHLLGINDFFTGLAAHARSHPGATLDLWWSERRCAEHYGQLVRPDGYGRWTEHGQDVEFFLEYDTGSEPLTRVTSKLPGYADLATAGGPNIPVLIWLPSARREANLRAALSTHPAPVTVATANTELAGALCCGPADAVWLVDSSQHRRPLIDLGTPAGAGHDRPTVANTGPPVADVW